MKKVLKTIISFLKNVEQETGISFLPLCSFPAGLSRLWATLLPTFLQVTQHPLKNEGGCR
jgi:hypothetical protein